jgi:hypothetical protein
MEKTPPSAENVTPPATPLTARPSTPVRRLTRRGRLALAVIVVIVGAALAIPRSSTAPAASSPADGQPERVEPLPGVATTTTTTPAPAAVSAITAAPVAVTPDTARPAVKEPSKSAATSRTEKNRTGASPKSVARLGASAPLAGAHTGADSAAIPAAPEPPTAGPALASASAMTTGVAPVTITGCLEVSVDHDEFRLSEIEGGDAPKSRSWRTGFLKKKSAPVALVEPADPQALHQQVGKRVAATGLLTSGELKVSSVRVVAPSCD